MKRLYLGFLCLLLWAVSTSLAYAGSDRPLLVSARYYKPLSRPWDRSYYHTYRFNSDGSGKTQLTFAEQDDVGACWSPDGKWIAFIRRYGVPSRNDVGDLQLCIQAARPHAPVRVILRLHNTYAGQVFWSGDGKCLAMEVYQKVYFVTPRGTLLRQAYPGSDHFDGYAPDGKHYAVSNNIVETLSGRITCSYPNGTWWDSKTFLAWTPVRDDAVAKTTNFPMTFTDVNGKTIRQVNLHPTALQKKYFLDEQNELLPIWEAAQIAPNSSLLYIGFGKPQEQLFADIHTGEIHRWQGQDTGVYPMQIAPQGKYAYSLRGFKDVAPYGKHKDGRVRFVAVNKLQVTDMRTPNTFRDIITGLVDIDSADWRR